MEFSILITSMRALCGGTLLRLAWNVCDLQIDLSQPPKWSLRFQTKTDEKPVVSLPESRVIRKERVCGPPRCELDGV